MILRAPRMSKGWRLIPRVLADKGPNCPLFNPILSPKSDCGFALFRLLGLLILVEL
jgi:hypothetical protein